MNYGTTGVGSDDHLLMLGLEGLAGLQPMTHAPFAGSAPLLAQVLGGHIELGVGNMGGAPDVPTFREQGFDMVAGSARGIAGPPGLPAPVRAKLEQAFAAALADPAFLREAQRVFLPLRPLVGAALEQLTRGQAAPPGRGSRISGSGDRPWNAGRRRRC